MTDPAAPDPAAAGAVDGAGLDLKAGQAGIGQANTEKEGGAQGPPQPYYVAAHGEPVFGMIEACLFGGFQASCWRGPIGIFPTSLEAERALLAEPRPPRNPKKQKISPPPLTLGEGGGPVFHGKLQIGGWIKVAGGFAGWWKGGKVGVHETPGLAGNAVLDAYLEAKAQAARPNKRQIVGWIRTGRRA